MDYSEITAFSDDAIALITPEEQNLDEAIENGEVDIEELDEYGEDYETEPDTEYLEDDEYEDDDEYAPPEEDDEEFEEIEIEGIGRVSIDDIVEWRQGNLRQSDYTRKTQEIARQREEMQEALNFYNYVKSNPQLLGDLQSGQTVYDDNLNGMFNPQNDQIKQLMYNQKALEVDMKLNELKSKYGDVDEVALFNKASEMKTDDLESVYKILNYDNQSNNVSMDQLKEQLRQELLQEIEQNKRAVRTTASTRQQSPTRVRNTVSSAEAKVAEGLGISLSEYAKWRG